MIIGASLYEAATNTSLFNRSDLQMSVNIHKTVWCNIFWWTYHTDYCKTLL